MRPAEGSVFQSSGIPKGRPTWTRQTQARTAPWLRGFSSARPQARQEFLGSQSAALTLELIDHDAAEDFGASPAGRSASVNASDIRPGDTDREHSPQGTIADPKEHESRSVKAPVVVHLESQSRKDSRIGEDGLPRTPGPGAFDLLKGGSHAAKPDAASAREPALRRPDAGANRVSNAPGAFDPLKGEAHTTRRDAASSTNTALRGRNDDKPNDVDPPMSRGSVSVPMAFAGSRPLLGEGAVLSGGTRPALSGYEESMAIKRASPYGIAVRRKPATNREGPASYQSSLLRAASQAGDQSASPVEREESAREADPSGPEAFFVISSMSGPIEASLREPPRSHRPERVAALEMLQRERPRDTAPVRHVHIGTLHVTVKAPAATPAQQAPQPQFTPMPRWFQERGAIRYDPWDSYRVNFD